MVESATIPVRDQRPTLENSVHYLAHTFSFLASGKDTGDAYALIHCHFRKGFTPPPHYHQFEEESFFMLDGIIDFHSGDRKITASKGDFVVLPRLVPHSFDLVTDSAKALLLITPAGFETLFKEFGRPAQTLELPALTGQPPKEMLHQIHKRCEELGNVWMPEI